MLLVGHLLRLLIFVTGTHFHVSFRVLMSKDDGLYPTRKSVFRVKSARSRKENRMMLLADKIEVTHLSSLPKKLSKREDVLQLLHLISLGRTAQDMSRVNDFLSFLRDSPNDLVTSNLHPSNKELSSIRQLDTIDIQHKPIQDISAHSNPEISALLSGWLEVKDAGRRGKGLFATRTIEKDTFLGEYEGEKLTYKQYLSRYPRGDSEYTFLVSEELQRRDRTYVDAADEKKSNLLRYVNHDSQNPNVKVEVVFTKYQDCSKEGIYDEKAEEKIKKMLESEFELVNDGNKNDVENMKNENNNQDKNKNKIINDKLYQNEIKSIKKKRKNDKNLKLFSRSDCNFEIRMTSIISISAGSELFFDYGPLYASAALWVSSNKIEDVQSAVN